MSLECGVVNGEGEKWAQMLKTRILYTVNDASWIDSRASHYIVARPRFIQRRQCQCCIQVVVRRHPWFAPVLRRSFQRNQMRLRVEYVAKELHAVPITRLDRPTVYSQSIASHACMPLGAKMSDSLGEHIRTLERKTPIKHRYDGYTIESSASSRASEK